MKQTWYDEEVDVLNINLDDKEYWKSIELGNGIVIDVSKDGSITAIEILGASEFFSGDNKKILEMAKST